jgi:hypothetical protein
VEEHGADRAFTKKFVFGASAVAIFLMGIFMAGTRKIKQLLRGSNYEIVCVKLTNNNCNRFIIKTEPFGDQTKLETKRAKTL